MLRTESLCPKCYRVIPAEIHIRDVVVMEKCCAEHGMFYGIVESDPIFYSICAVNRDSSIYDGYLIDVTGKCNLDCKYCYHDKQSGHRSVESIIHEVKNAGVNPPFVLTGGEPTLHPALPDIIYNIKKYGEVVVLTNGIMLTKNYIKGLADAGLLYGDLLGIGLSMHPESCGRDENVLRICRSLGYSIATAICVIDEISQMDDCLNLYRKYPDVIQDMRIKAAASVWSATRNKKKIFMSDMMKYFSDKKITIKNEMKTSYVRLEYDGMNIVLVCWYDASNVDLRDINCPPYYQAKDGLSYNVVTTFLVNEGIDNANS